MLFFFGLLLFCGSIGGFMAHHWPWLPSITGFMLVGFLVGPNVMGLVSYAELASSSIVVDVALGLILYRLGLSLDIKQLVHDKSLLALNNMIAFMVFAALLPALYAEGRSPIETVVGAPLYSFLGLAAMGSVVGLVLHFTARRFKGAAQYHRW